MRSGITRRQFVAASAAVAAGTVVAQRASAAPRAGSQRESAILFQELAHAAIDAAKSAGAQYADVRITRELVQQWQIEIAAPSEIQLLGAGVRVLYNGYWGFAASPLWTTDEMARLARAATEQAKIAARGKPRSVDWLSVPPARGTWAAAAERDPLTVAPEEIRDFLDAIHDQIPNAASAIPNLDATLNRSIFRLRKLEKTFASTDGALATQTLYSTDGDLAIDLSRDHAPIGSAHRSWPSRAMGWEYIFQPSLFGQLPGIIAEGYASTSVPVKPVDVGRYDVVLSSKAMAAMLAATIGPATQLDRAMGYEANAGGTSYLGDPLGMLGTFQAASSLVTVTADRSTPGAVATVQWDDDGVIPEDFTLIQRGTLVDFQTAREQAAWLAPWYAKQGRPVRSHGCANSYNGLDLSLLHTPNLSLRPGDARRSVDDLVAGTARGIYLDDITVSMDAQRKNGMTDGAVREIVNGKLGAYLAGGAMSFNSLGFWVNVIALGGPETTAMWDGGDSKGQPSSGTTFSVSAVPAKVTGMGVVDRTRRA